MNLYGDEYTGVSDVGAPATRATVVTKDGSAVLGPEGLPDLPKFIYVGTAGDLAVRFYAGGPVRTFKGAGVGYHPLRVYSVEAATTAADILALY